MIGRKFLAFTAFLALAAGSYGADSASLTVAAAANVRPALDEIRSAFERRSGIRVTASYGASGILARQIEQGAPFDLFLSADSGFVDRLERERLVAVGKRAVYAEGTLVVVTASGGPACRGVSDLEAPAFRRIAIAKPEIAPYGRAAVEALTRAGAIDGVRPRLVFAESVRDALRYVEAGDAEAGFVADSEARQTALPRFEVPRTLYAPIRQEAAVLAGSAHAKEAAAFFGFLRGAEAREIWTRHGYRLP
ncbi:MAG TPA: molybdate ABC transporter substrate-binding protein [Thermoanaerobaculia bacterium]|nr:molybdate ABC transporter substrate-binding protein [Thermoanaerobaculia bacterium]